jgi:hypothetical protein
MVVRCHQAYWLSVFSQVRSTSSFLGWPMPRAAGVGVFIFVSPRMSRNTAAVVHTPARVTQDDIRVLWRRLPETILRSYHAVLASIKVATGPGLRVCALYGQMLATMRCPCCGVFVSTSHACPEHALMRDLRVISAGPILSDRFTSFVRCSNLPYCRFWSELLSRPCLQPADVRGVAWTVFIARSISQNRISIALSGMYIKAAVVRWSSCTFSNLRFLCQRLRRCYWREAPSCSSLSINKTERVSVENWLRDLRSFKNSYASWPFSKGGFPNRPVVSSRLSARVTTVLSLDRADQPFNFSLMP